MKPDIAAPVSATGSREQNVEVCGLGSGGVALEILVVDVGGVGGDDVKVAGDTVVRDPGDVGWNAVADGVDEFGFVVFDGESAEVVVDFETCVGGLECSYDFLASNARRVCPPEKQLVRTMC